MKRLFTSLTLFIICLIASAQSSKNLFDDMISWNAEDSNITEQKMDYLRENLTNEARQYVAQHADDSDQDWQTAISLLNAPYVEFKADELTQLTKVRSLQIQGNNIYGYSYFNCRFYWEVRSLCFDKTAGSQRKTGILQRVTNDKLVLDGFWYNTVDGPSYDNAHRSFAILQKTYDGRFFMLFPADKYNNYEIYLFR